MNEYRLTGIDGTRLLGFRAALGTICLAPPASTLRWDGVMPILSIPDEFDQLVNQILDYARTRRFPVESGRVDGLDAESWRELCRENRSDFQMSSWLAALGSDTATGKVQKSIFDLTSGQQSWVKIQIELSDKIEENHLREALLGPWLESDSVHHLGWDFELQLFSAKHHMEATKLEKRSSLGAVWLANESLPLQPVWLGKTCGTARQWDLWKTPLNRWEVQALLMKGQPQGALQVKGKDVGGQRSAFASANL